MRFLSTITTYFYAGKIREFPTRKKGGKAPPFLFPPAFSPPLSATK
jgi:hypothetical protein